jgi:hypothetical protein
VTSEPAGADVFINGRKHLGSQTPTAVPLTPGEYDFVLRLEGYEAYAGRVQVKNEPAQLDAKLSKKAPNR